MSNVAVTVDQIVPGGVKPTVNSSLSVSDNYQLQNDGKMFLHIDNGGGGASVVTIVSQKVDAGLALADRIVSVPAGEERMIGPFPPAIFNDANGLVNVTFDVITSVALSGLHLG